MTGLHKGIDADLIVSRPPRPMSQKRDRGVVLEAMSADDEEDLTERVDCPFSASSIIDISARAIRRSVRQLQRVIHETCISGASMLESDS